MSQSVASDGLQKGCRTLGNGGGGGGGRLPPGVEAAARRLPRRVRAPGRFCSPCGGRGLAVEIRYANELGCIELVLLGMKGTNSMHVSPKTFAFRMYAPTNPPYAPTTRRASPARSSCVVNPTRVVVNSRSSPPLARSLLAACKIKLISGEKS